MMVSNQSLMAQSVLHGLQTPYKTLPCKYFYDQKGSELFEQICSLPEYYPTRTEIQILRKYAGFMADEIGPSRILIEYGCGSSVKTPLLIQALEPTVYIPIDISKECLLGAAGRIQFQFPALKIHPLCADYTRPLHLNGIANGEGRRLLFFPGSTLGNFTPDEARRFLQRMRELCGQDGAILIGIDLIKEKNILEPAYNDSNGVTAEFNINLLHHLNRVLDTTIPTQSFRHYAYWNERDSRMEMHLISRKNQTLFVGGEEIPFQRDEPIHTESSYKYDLDYFAELTRSAGLAIRTIWTDERRWFAVLLLDPAV